MEVEEGSRRSDGDMAAAAVEIELNEIGGGGCCNCNTACERKTKDTACNACEPLIRGWTAKNSVVWPAASPLQKVLR